MRLFEWSLLYFAQANENIYNTRFDVCNIAYFDDFEKIEEIRTTFRGDPIQFTKITTNDFEWSNGQKLEFTESFHQKGVTYSNRDLIVFQKQVRISKKVKIFCPIVKNPFERK